MKAIRDYEIINHGIKHSDYFQGCGVCGTDYTDVATGIGDSESEALEDALDQLAQADWDTEHNTGINHACDVADTTNVIAPIITLAKFVDDDYQHPYVYVSIRVR